VLEHYLSGMGAEFHSADSAAAGIEAARAAANAGSRFDLVLLDYQLPQVGAMGFLRELRAEPSLCGTPCVVLSSLGDRVEEANGLSIAAWLAKPVRKGDLERLLAGIAGQNGIGPAPSDRRARALTSYPRARVLVVEDNEVNQKVVLRLLQAFDIDARLVSDGSQAVTAIRDAEFDLVFMDCQMPVLDGYDATRAIRNFSSVRVVAMTANALTGDRERCLASGMDDYMTKPVKRDVLASMLDRWLPLSTRAAVSFFESLPTISSQAGIDPAEGDGVATSQLTG
jgi:CheY-like chemotaxis protein